MTILYGGRVPKQTKDFKVDTNLTGQQISYTLDTLLFSAIEALIYGTKFVDQHVLSILNWVARNNRRRVSSFKDKGRQLSCLSNYLLASEPRDKLRFYVAFRPDRYVSLGILQRFETAVTGYSEIYELAMAGKAEPNQLKELEEIEKAVGSNRRHLWSVINAVKDFKAEALRFRNYVVRKYLALCQQEASKIRRSSSLRVSEKDLTQNLAQAVIIALDKYDYHKGALTTYIRPWLRYLSQSPEFGHNPGLAYDIPHNHKAKIGKTGYSNIAVSVETGTGDEEGEGTSHKTDEGAAHQSIEAFATEMEDAGITLRLLAHADPIGILRLGLGIGEWVSPILIRAMREQMRKEAKATKVPIFKPSVNTSRSMVDVPETKAVDFNTEKE